MNRYPSLAMDLPLKALVWETGDGKVWLSYNSPEFLRQRHVLDALPFGGIGQLLQTATRSQNREIVYFVFSHSCQRSFP
ncbi:MAG TPA: DUF302 domain-containing protein [Verrucomicrobiae bacterium]|jgi:hypothetical protein|nr:DUF302 domain-containing protein [Verrucomicrobiae bacterium]